MDVNWKFGSSALELQALVREAEYIIVVEFNNNYTSWHMGNFFKWTVSVWRQNDVLPTECDFKQTVAMFVF